MHSNYNKNQKILYIYLKYIDIASMKDRKISSSLCALIQRYSHNSYVGKISFCSTSNSIFRGRQFLFNGIRVNSCNGIHKIFWMVHHSMNVSILFYVMVPFPYVGKYGCSRLIFFCNKANKVFSSHLFSGHISKR